MKKVTAFGVENMLKEVKILENYNLKLTEECIDLKIEGSTKPSAQYVDWTPSGVKLNYMHLKSNRPEIW